MLLHSFTGAWNPFPKLDSTSAGAAERQSADAQGAPGARPQAAKRSRPLWRGRVSGVLRGAERENAPAQDAARRAGARGGAEPPLVAGPRQRRDVLPARGKP